MSNFVVFKGNTVIDYLRDQDDAYFVNRPDVLKNPDLSAVDGIDIRYWKKEGDQILPMTSIERYKRDNDGVTTNTYLLPITSSGEVRTRAVIAKGITKYAIGDIYVYTARYVLRSPFTVYRNGTQNHEALKIELSLSTDGILSIRNENPAPVKYYVNAMYL